MCGNRGINKGSASSEEEVIQAQGRLHQSAVKSGCDRINGISQGVGQSGIRGLGHRPAVTLGGVQSSGSCLPAN